MSYTFSLVILLSVKWKKSCKILVCGWPSALDSTALLVGHEVKISGLWPLQTFVLNRTVKHSSLVMGAVIHSWTLNAITL